MKILDFSYLLFLVILFLSSICGCGAGEDEVPMNKDTLLSLSEEFQWPPGTTGELWELTDLDVAELLAINPPPGWHETEDIELRKKYKFAQLLKQFGDIPEVRYLIAFQRKIGKNVTREQAIAYSEAMYRLYPNSTNLKALQEIKKFGQQGPNRTNKEWAEEDPEGYAEHLLATLIKRYGDIPEVHTYMRFERKKLLGKKLTEAELDEKNKVALYLQSLDED